MRIRIGASLSRAPISVARLIYIREGGSGAGGWDGGGSFESASLPSARDAILARETRYFLRRRYVLHTYVRPRSVTTERRNRDLYLPESAAP